MCASCFDEAEQMLGLFLGVLSLNLNRGKTKPRNESNNHLLSFILIWNIFLQKNLTAITKNSAITQFTWFKFDLD